jgi:large subunit ribosomal protein L18e
VRKSKTTNPELIELIRFLKKGGRENKAQIWRDIAERLAKPRSRSVVVNLSRLERYTEKRETVVVPGKVLAAGQITHPITVAAFAFSERAAEKIGAAKGKCVSFADLVKKNPTGSKIRILG